MWVQDMVLENKPRPSNFSSSFKCVHNLEYFILYYSIGNNVKDTKFGNT